MSPRRIQSIRTIRGAVMPDMDVSVVDEPLNPSTAGRTGICLFTISTMARSGLTTLPVFLHQTFQLA